MFNSFLLLTPALPDEIISRYFEYYLKKCTSELNRQLNFARMMGRYSDFEERRLELLPVIYASFLEHGIRRRFPADKIDPKWDKSTLEIVLRLYEVEARAALSKHTRDQLLSTYASLTGETLNDEEHIAQLRAAHLRARLNALKELKPEHRHETAPMMTNGTSTEPECESPIQENVLPHATTVTSTTPHSTVTTEPNPLNSNACNLKADTKTQEVCKTMKSLENHFISSRDFAQNATPETWSDDIAHIFWRASIENNMSKDVAKQRGSDIRRFMFITGISKISEIKQAHLTHWADSLQKIPKNFMRSEKDAHRTIDEVYLNARHLAPEERGLDPSTKRRHVKSMELLIARARAEDIPLPALETAGLKPKKKSSRNKHKSRAVFHLDEARLLFTHPIWTGSRSEGRRHEAGTTIVKDGKYWIPLVLAYTGARRAEIAGMLTSDVQVINNIPCFVIQSNAYRGIKGETADCQEGDRLTRVVPIHSHLIELGIMEYAKSIADKGHELLFPDVVPVPRKNGKRSMLEDPALSVEKFGERFDDAWRKAMKIALKGNARKLCIHSLRHYVNHTLLHCGGVLDVTRTDILGHIDSDGKESINTSTYRDETPLSVKRDALEKLPRLM